VKRIGTKIHPKDKRYRIPAPPIKLPSSLPSINSGRALLKRETGKGEGFPPWDSSLSFDVVRQAQGQDERKSIKLTSLRVADNMKVRSKHDE
jgi:hypothetical protein